MDLNDLISNLKSLLIDFSDNKNNDLNTNLLNLFSSLNVENVRKDIDSFSEIVLLVASLFELKAKSLLPQNEDVDWIDEIQLIKDKDLAFARLLQFKAFSEVGIALASRILQDQLQPFINFDEPEIQQDQSSAEKLSFNSNLLKKVEELELSVRSANCLKNDNIIYIGDLVQKSEGEMLRTPNFGRKSLNEIKEVLTGMSLYLGMEIPNWPPDNIAEMSKKLEEAI